MWKGRFGVIINGCSTAPITDRRQLKIIPESKLTLKLRESMKKLKKKRR